jgi:hypothetical protein
MKKLFEKHKISHLNTNDGKVFMIHENALEDIAKEYLTEQCNIADVIGRSEQYCDWCSSPEDVEVKICKRCRQGMEQHR